MTSEQTRFEEVVEMEPIAGDPDFTTRSAAAKPAKPSRTCATCQHWDRTDNGWGRSVRLPRERFETDEQEQAAIKAIEDLYGLCQGVAEIPDYDDWDNPPLAYTMDGSRYSANLYTQAAFGCTLWKARA